jgi:hypothetical protein
MLIKPVISSHKKQSHIFPTQDQDVHPLDLPEIMRVIHGQIPSGVPRTQMDNQSITMVRVPHPFGAKQ